MADFSGRTLGDFVLREQIGEGGWGAVYRCEQPLLERDVVVKVLHPQQQSNGIAKKRFLREARLASRLDHPYAAHVYAFGVAQEDGLQWIAMELVQGITLDDWLRTRGPMPLEQFVPFFECVAEVVQTAHERGIVHRDLKPSNIMVIERGGRLFPRLLDFGIAKMNHKIMFADDHEPGGADGVVTVRIRATPRRVQRPRPDPDVICSQPNGDELTRSGAAFGSTPYMSPEQWSDAAAVGPASDIYSLGVVAYEALTGRRPFTADSTAEYYQRHREAEVPRLGGDFSPDLDRVLRCALGKYPEARHRNVLELASELRAVLRASDREQLRSSAQQWEAKGRAPGLLWGGDVLADHERWARCAPSSVLSELECSFVAASQRRARRVLRVRRSLVALAAVSVFGGVFGGLLYRAALRTRTPEQIATESEVEQGRGPECDTAESLAPDQRFIALSCRHHGTRVWDTARGELLADLPDVTTVEGGYYSAFPALTATGDRAAIARGNTVEVYALPGGQLLRTITHPTAVNAVAFAPAGHDLVSGAVDGSVRITRDDREPIALPTSPAGIDAVAILPDGRAVVADASARLRVIDPDRSALLMDLAAPSRVRLLRPSPDGGRLITISTSEKQAPPALWDLDQHRLIAQLDGHVGRVFTARFVTGGHELLTAGRDGTVRLWNTATGIPLQTFRGDSHFLVDATLAPDGSVVVAGGSDGLLRFWDASNGRLLWMLQAHKSYVVGVHYEGSDIVSRGFAGDVSRWTLPPSDRIIEACHASACASAALAEN